MMTAILESLSGLVPFLCHFGGAVALLLLFVLIYGLVTPYPEHRLIQEGKTAPAVSFGGAILGFTCPMVSAIAHSVSLTDMIVWSLVALAVQILVFLVMRLFLHHLIKDVAEDKMGPAILLAIVSVAVGLLNAASMTY